MKEQDVKLTIQETEQLCRLYMDCRLSVLEETELQYVLGRLPYTSPCIDEVRMLMGLTVPPKTFKTRLKPFGFLRSRSAVSIAASFALLFIIVIAFLLNKSASGQSSDELYIAYANGQEVSPEQAVRQVEADMKTAEEFLSHIEELESREQRMVDSFINQISSEQ